MYRNEIITTKARPMKKVCIIEDNDYKKLFEIINIFSSEIGGFLNLILVNDEELFSENLIEFIKWHDPDIIINFSACDNNELNLKFNMLTIDGKNMEFNLKTLSTPLSCLNNFPGFLKSEFETSIKDIYIRYDEEAKIENLIYYVNFGLVTKEFEALLKGNFFENINFNNFDTISKLFDIFLHSKKENIIFISKMLSSCGWSNNRQSIDHNKENYYNKDPTVIFGSNTSIKSIIYFWNMRATYPQNSNIWLPIELFDEYKDYLKHFSSFCIFSEKNSTEFKQRILEVNNSLSEIKGTKYYFNSKKLEWEFFRHTQNTSIINKKFTINHPNEKLLSIFFNINVVLEISGLEEFILPNCFKLGELFKEPAERTTFKHSFSRISSNGLAFDFNSIGLFGSPYIDELYIPDVMNIFQTFFNEYGLRLEKTPGSQITDQLISLFDGYKNLEILCNKDMFELLIKLTPKRIQSLINEITKDLPICIDAPSEIQELIGRKIDPVNILTSNIIVEAQNLFGRLTNVSNKVEFYPSVQALYEMNILLRGKSFKCPSCNSQLWYPLSSIKDEIRCYCCNSFVNIPIFSGNKAINDSFRLNELVINSVDQGVLPVLLTASFLFKQGIYATRFIFDSNIYEDSELLSEIDIIFTLGKRVGLAEVKADRGFDCKQVDKLLEVALRINADMVLFSTIKKKNSEEVTELCTYIKSKNLNFPAFIITEETLFTRELIRLNKYFEVNDDNVFPKGPILVTNK